jgi:hypothetical protein
VANNIWFRGIEPDMGGYVRVHAVIANQYGGSEVELKFADRGDEAANKKHAYKEVLLWLQEALAFLESHPDLL